MISPGKGFINLENHKEWGHPQAIGIAWFPIAAMTLSIFRSCSSRVLPWYFCVPGNNLLLMGQSSVCSSLGSCLLHLLPRKLGLVFFFPHLLLKIIRKLNAHWSPIHFLTCHHMWSGREVVKGIWDTLGPQYCEGGREEWMLLPTFLATKQ